MSGRRQELAPSARDGERGAGEGEGKAVEAIVDITARWGAAPLADVAAAPRRVRQADFPLPAERIA